MKNTFVEISQRYFYYLIQDYKFELLSLVESPRGYYWEGELIYVTQDTYVCVKCVRGESPSINIGRIRDCANLSINQRKYSLPLYLIYEFMVTDNREKEIITSSSSQAQAVKIINQKHMHFELPLSNQLENQHVIEIEIYANLLKQYAYPFLQGDFSNWVAVWEYKVKSGIAQEVGRGRSEYKDVVVSDGNGKYKIIGKKHLFQDALDYIERTKNEK